MRYGSYECMTVRVYVANLWRMGLTLLCMMSVITALAQEVRWEGDITLTTTVEKSEFGRTESLRRVERWTDFVTYNSEDDGSFASFDATWTVTEVRSETWSDCSSSGVAEGSGEYPWFLFDVNPFDEWSYVLYSGGHGGGPEVAGKLTVNCRNQPSYTVDYTVIAGALMPVAFSVPDVLAMIPPEVLESLPPETLAMMLELEATLQQEADEDVFAVTGRIDPAAPRVIQGSAEHESDGVRATLRWNLTRPYGCDDAEERERLAREAQILMDAQANGEFETLPEAEAGLYAASSISHADVTAALMGALAQAHEMALGKRSGSDAAGLQQFGVRLSRTGQVLPSLEHLQRLIDTTCVQKGSLEGARTLMLGSVQWMGNEFRVNVRTIEVETAVIIDTLSVRGSGGKSELPAALERAFSHFLRRSL